MPRINSRGVSPAVSYVLLLALVVIISIGAYLWGNYNIQKLEDIPLYYNVESQFISADYAIQNTARGDTNFTSTLELYYPKGVVQLIEERSMIKFTGYINTNVFDGPPEGIPSDECTDASTLIKDDETGLKLARMPQTNVYRGGGEGEGQFIEVALCFPDIELVGDDTCIGRSGPRATLTTTKTGYNATSQKPVVEVRIC